MTPIESIYEIREGVMNLRKHLDSRDRVVSKRAQMLCVQLVDRFFRESRRFIKPEERFPCLHDPGHFLKLMDSAIEYYDMNQ